jgi:hypothetical protein
MSSEIFARESFRTLNHSQKCFQTKVILLYSFLVRGSRLHCQVRDVPCQDGHVPCRVDCLPRQVDCIPRRVDCLEWRSFCKVFCCQPWEVFVNAALSASDKFHVFAPLATKVSMPLRGMTAMPAAAARVVLTALPWLKMIEPT